MYSKGDMVATLQGRGVIRSIMVSDYDASGYLYSVELDRCKGCYILYSTNKDEPKYRIIRKVKD